MITTYVIHDGFPILNGCKIIDPVDGTEYTFISGHPLEKTVYVKNAKGDFILFPAIRFDITFKDEEADGD